MVLGKVACLRYDEQADVEQHHLPLRSQTNGAGNPFRLAHAYLSDSHGIFWIITDDISVSILLMLSLHKSAFVFF